MTLLPVSQQLCGLDDPYPCPYRNRVGKLDCCTSNGECPNQDPLKNVLTNDTAIVYDISSGSFSPMVMVADDDNEFPVI